MHFKRIVYLTVLALLLVAGIWRTQLFTVIREMRHRAELHERFEKILKQGGFSDKSLWMRFSDAQWESLVRPTDHEIILRGEFYDILSVTECEGFRDVCLISDKEEKALEKDWERRAEEKEATGPLLKIPSLVFVLPIVYTSPLPSVECSAEKACLNAPDVLQAFLPAMMKPPARLF